jgi:hypothetical protein
MRHILAGKAVSDRAQRTPTLLFVLVGVLLLRFAARVLFELLFHAPPRNTPRRPASPHHGTERPADAFTIAAWS